MKLFKRTFTCEECRYCNLEQKDDEFHAPCLVNPPSPFYVEKKDTWISGRPYTMIKSIACQFGKRKK
jgi:hypothetical protein